jgi:putative alpha-1,2-mannosidase
VKPWVQSQAQIKRKRTVTLATWETEIGRITVLGQPGQKKFLKPCLYRKKLSKVKHSYLSQLLQEV